MKHLLALLLAAFLLAGCAQASVPEAAPTGSPTAVTAPAGLWDPDAPLEARTQGAVRVYPMDTEAPCALFAMGESVLVLSGEGNSTLTRLVGDTLYISAQTTLDLALRPEELQVTDNSIRYADTRRGLLVVLDPSLKEIRRISLPEGCTSPILSPDQETLYYATGTAIKAWDLTQDTHRTVAELSQEQTITALCLDGSVLQCRTEVGVQLLRTEDGSFLWQGEDLTLATARGRYYAAIPAGARQELLFGDQSGTVQCLTPADLWVGGTFLPRLHGCLTRSFLPEGGIRLDYYNLTTGRRQSCLTLADATLLWADGTWEGWLYLLLDTTGGPVLLRWDPTSPSINERETYTGPRYTRQSPDYHGLLSCQAQAEVIGQTYGVEVLLWDETEDLAPWDYTLEAEYSVPVLEEALTQLDRRLSQFPPGFLETCTGNFSGLTICLVRSITGKAGSGGLDTADGIEYLAGTRAYIALTTGPAGEKALYHELYHVMETQILNKSTALDQWDKLNPAGFQYTCDYAANETRPVGSWLDDDIRSFVDRYSMSYPKEDRARLFEYAITAGNQDLFAASPLQYKLRQLCIGIREAFGLKKSTEVFPWEQYLWQPLTPEK